MDLGERARRPRCRDRRAFSLGARDGSRLLPRRRRPPISEEPLVAPRPGRHLPRRLSERTALHKGSIAPPRCPQASPLSAGSRQDAPPRPARGRRRTGTTAPPDGAPGRVLPSPRGCGSHRRPVAATQGSAASAEVAARRERLPFPSNAL